MILGTAVSGIFFKFIFAKIAWFLKVKFKKAKKSRSKIVDKNWTVRLKRKILLRVEEAAVSNIQWKFQADWTKSVRDIRPGRLEVCCFENRAFEVLRRWKRAAKGAAPHLTQLQALADFVPRDFYDNTVRF